LWVEGWISDGVLGSEIDMLEIAKEQRVTVGVSQFLYISLATLAGESSPSLRERISHRYASEDSSIPFAREEMGACCAHGTAVRKREQDVLRSAWAANVF